MARLFRLLARSAGRLPSSPSPTPRKSPRRAGPAQRPCRSPVSPKRKASVQAIPPESGGRPPGSPAPVPLGSPPRAGRAPPPPPRAPCRSPFSLKNVARLFSARASSLGSSLVSRTRRATATEKSSMAPQSGAATPRHAAPARRPKPRRQCTTGRGRVSQRLWFSRRVPSASRASTRSGSQRHPGDAAAHRRALSKRWRRSGRRCPDPAPPSRRARPAGPVRSSAEMSSRFRR